MKLNKKQRFAADFSGNVVVTACPGSGKTRTLIARIIRGLSELTSEKHRVVALTFTNRAADEIRSRLDEEGVDSSCLWAGTVHSFALEWILRPYAPYLDELRRGFSTADEFESGKILAELKKERGLNFYDEINTIYNRHGFVNHSDSVREEIFQIYKKTLTERKLLDYDDILYLAFKVLEKNPEISDTLGQIFELVCVDEVQDIQDLQYGILSEVFKASQNSFELFLVGDEDQSIYETLGALTKSPDEIAEEFGLLEIKHLSLSGNYRSTQRIVDFFSKFSFSGVEIESLTDYRDELGLIQFENQSIDVDQLSEKVASLIQFSLDQGIPENEICVIAPRWFQVRQVARSLIGHLPDVDFDAPGLSPLYGTRDNIWFKLARLFLTNASSNKSRSRIRWANEIIQDLISLDVLNDSDWKNGARKLLRITNSISSVETSGLAFLEDVFSQLEQKIGFITPNVPQLNELKEVFFEKTNDKIKNSDFPVPEDTLSFRKLFNHPSGVVVNTCHGVKGEEYETVIALGLLTGFVPHWQVLFNREKSEDWKLRQQANLLYVICSRAKRNLFLISESGRKTNSGNLYQTSEMLDKISRNWFD